MGACKRLTGNGGAAIVLNLVLVIVSILVSCVLAELLFRAFGPTPSELSAEHIWRSQSPSFPPKEEGSAVIGGFKFREEEFGEEVLGKGVIRILFLGDSFTVGYGIRNRADRFTDLIEARLKNTPSVGSKPFDCHVFNAAKPDADPPRRWLDYLKVVEPVYHPHLVYGVFFLRDGTPLSTSLFAHKQVIDPIRERYENMPLYQHSRLLKAFYQSQAWREFTEYLKARITAAYIGSDKERVKWERQKQFLGELSRLCQQTRCDFHLVIFPILRNLDDYEFHGVEAEIASFARAHGIPVFPLLPGFSGYEDRTLWVASNDQHPNEKAHRIAAETLFPYIAKSVDELRRTNER